MREGTNMTQDFERNPAGHKTFALLVAATMGELWSSLSGSFPIGSPERLPRLYLRATGWQPNVLRGEGRAALAEAGHRLVPVRLRALKMAPTLQQASNSTRWQARYLSSLPHLSPASRPG